MSRELLEKCADYSQIIIWGYGHLGKLIYHYLTLHNISIHAVWDAAGNNADCENISILKPFARGGV